jgi:RNA polymerase sigma-70 factor (ECF subfamily)
MRNEDRWGRLAALLQPIHPQAVATARRLCRSAADGDDLYQEAVLRAFDKLHTLRDESRFRSWFYATLLSRHRSRVRRKFWRRFLPWEGAFPDGVGPAGEDGNRWDERALGTRRAAEALATLPAEQREAVVLFEIDGYSIEEIASMQRTSVPAVKSRLVRGRERLRRFYERRGFAPAASRGGADRAIAITPVGDRRCPRLATVPTPPEERTDD